MIKQEESKNMSDGLDTVGVATIGSAVTSKEKHDQTAKKMPYKLNSDVPSSSVTPELDKLKPKLRAYIVKHRGEWIAVHQKTSSTSKIIPPKMKRFFKKQNLSKRLAKEVLAWKVSFPVQQRDIDADTSSATIQRKSTMQVLFGNSSDVGTSGATDSEAVNVVEIPDEASGKVLEEQVIKQEESKNMSDIQRKSTMDSAAGGNNEQRIERKSTVQVLFGSDDAEEPANKAANKTTSLLAPPIATSSAAENKEAAEKNVALTAASATTSTSAMVTVAPSLIVLHKCKGCGNEKPKSDYSRSQWKKKRKKGTAVCKVCAEALK